MTIEEINRVSKDIYSGLHTLNFLSYCYESTVGGGLSEEASNYMIPTKEFLLRDWLTDNNPEAIKELEAFEQALRDMGFLEDDTKLNAVPLDYEFWHGVTDEIMYSFVNKLEEMDDNDYGLSNLPNPYLENLMYNLSPENAKEYRLTYIKLSPMLKGIQKFN